MDTDEVAAQDTVVTSGGVPLAVRVHRSGDAGWGRQPAVVVMGSWLTVKEQMPDLAAVVEALGSWSWVDPARLGAVGVCASAQYTLGALARRLPVGAFAAVAGWFHDLTSVAPFYGGPDGVAAKLAVSSQAARRFSATGELTTVAAYAAGDSDAAMSLEMDYYTLPERGAVAQWRNEMSLLSWHPWLTYDAFAPLPGVRTPPFLYTARTPSCPTTLAVSPRASVIKPRLCGPMALRPTSTTNRPRWISPCKR